MGSEDSTAATVPFWLEILSVGLSTFFSGAVSNSALVAAAGGSGTAMQHEGSTQATEISFFAGMTSTALSTSCLGLVCKRTALAAAGTGGSGDRTGTARSGAVALAGASTSFAVLVAIAARLLVSACAKAVNTISAKC